MYVKVDSLLAISQNATEMFRILDYPSHLPMQSMVTV